MKQNTKILPIILIIGLLFGVAYFTTDYFATTGFSGTSVNIAFGDIPETNPDGIVGKYYVGTALIDGDSSKYVFVPNDMTYKEAIALQFTAKNSLWKTSVINPSGNIYYSTVYKSWVGTYESATEPVPFKTVDMSNARISLSADVKLGMPDGSVKTGSIGNTGDYTQRFTVKDSDGADRTIYIRYNELSFKSGDLPPTGDLDIIEKPVSGYRLISHDNLVDGTGPIETSIFKCAKPDSWNCYFKDKVMWGKYSYIDEYSDYFNWMVSNNKIPDKKPNVAIGYSIAGNELIITYPSTVFTQSITFYIPEELAQYIMIIEQVPEFKFNEINNIYTNEGDLTKVSISGYAVGSGTINLYVDGIGEESYSWTGGSEKQIVEGESYKFELWITSSQVDVNSKLPITVYSQPSGMGIATQVTFYNDIKDTSALPSYDLTIKCIDSNKQTVTNAEIYVDNIFVGYGVVTKSVIKGDHYVHAQNVTGWYSGYPPNSFKFVNVDKDVSIEIPFTEEPPEDGYPLWTYIIFGIFGVVIFGFIVLILQEWGIEITTTHILIFIAIVLFIVMIWYGFGLLERLIEALENFKLFGD